MLDPAWLDWYKSRHESRSRSTGTQFEDYLSEALGYFYPDYFNPNPTGQLGDGGCDGFAEAATLLFACYGSRAQSEQALCDKLNADFIRGRDQWDSHTRWLFLTNAFPGPKCGQALAAIQQDHGPGAPRPIAANIWLPDRVWVEIISGLDRHYLDALYPGVPHAANFELQDVVPLLAQLESGQPHVGAVVDEVRPVPQQKISFNNLPESAIREFGEGRIMAYRIDGWYDGLDDPEAREVHGDRFRQIYEGHRLTTSDPGEILERIYTSLGGSDFRHDSKRAMAVYAITAYFFDSCHIFEEPPADALLAVSHASS